MGILRPVVYALVLAVLDTGHNFTPGGAVAVQLVGDQDTRCPALPFQKLAEQACGGFLVTPAPDEDVENKAILIDGAPEPVLPAGHGDDDLVKRPLVAAAWHPPADAVGECAATISSTLRRRSGNR